MLPVIVKVSPLTKDLLDDNGMYASKIPVLLACVAAEQMNIPYTVTLPVNEATTDPSSAVAPEAAAAVGADSRADATVVYAVTSLAADKNVANESLADGFTLAPAKPRYQLVICVPPSNTTSRTWFLPTVNIVFAMFTPF